jgi:hypothetical protein
MLQDLPDIFIDNVLSFLDDATIVNICLSCKNIYTNFKYVIENRKEIKETAIKNGERYKKMITFYENTMKNEPHHIFDSLNEKKYQTEMYEWYSALQIHDIIYNRIYTYNFKEFSGHLEIIDKLGMKNDENYYFYKLLLHNFVSVSNTLFEILVPHSILIPPRTDILII